MKKSKLQLTISILVSNNIGTIQKCMESIQPILKSIPSELIVVDTVGRENSDGSLAVAEKYADVIIPFTWCNDFSAARNAGLKGAKGEWLLYMDDDEWFDDVSDIITFFKSGKYKKYAMALYRQRNYFNFQGTFYKNAYVGRMVQLHYNTHFVRTIHERPVPVFGEECYLESFVHHFGYIHTTQEAAKAHTDRNTALLLKEIERHPDSTEDYSYLAQEHLTNNAYSKVEETTRYAIDNLPVKKADLDLHLNAIRVAYIRSLFFQDKYKEVIEEGEKILSGFPISDMAAGAIYMHISEAAEYLEDWERTIEYAYKTFKVNDAYKAFPEKYKMQEIFDVTLEIFMRYIDNIAHQGIIGSLKLGRAEDTTKILQLFWKEKLDVNRMLELLEKYKKENETYRAIITQSLSKVDNDHTYILLNKLLSIETNGIDEAQQLFDNYIERKEYDIAYMADVLRLASKHRIQIEGLTSRVNEPIWNVWLQNAYARMSILELQGLRENLENALLKENKIKYTIFLCDLEKYILLNKTEIGKNLQALDVDRYCEVCTEKYHSIYKDELFQEDNQQNLPEETQFIICLVQALDYKKTGAWADCIALLKKALTIYPPMKAVVQTLLDSVLNSIEESRNAEFDSLKLALIQEASRFIEGGKRAEANMIMHNLKKLLPDDLEIAALEDRILNME